MLLAAGRGSRLRPLTDQLPKPLLEVAGETLAARHVRRLAAAGIDEIVVNLHHLGDQVRAHLGDGARFGTRVTYAPEATLLETAGGIRAVLERFEPDPFLVVSADIWTQYPFARLRRLDAGSSAHVVLVRSPLASDFDFASPPQPGARARIAGAAHPQAVAAVSPPAFAYANIALLHPCLFRHLPRGHRPLREVLFAARDAGVLTGEIYSGAWFNVGTIEELAALRRHVATAGVDDG
jgi:MurNAc alpha-1-phosphate uridylyltransferase